MAVSYTNQETGLPKKETNLSLQKWGKYKKSAEYCVHLVFCLHLKESNKDMSITYV